MSSAWTRLFFEVTRTGRGSLATDHDTTLVQGIRGESVDHTAVHRQFGRALVLMVATSPRLTLMIVAVLILVMLPLMILGRRVRTLSGASQDRVADTSAWPMKTLKTQIQTFSRFTLEESNSRVTRARLTTPSCLQSVRIRIRAFLVATATSFVIRRIIIVLWIGAHDVMNIA